METLADYGAASYFGLQTFTTSIYRAWFSLGDRLAASQLAAVLLVLVLILFFIEHRAAWSCTVFYADREPSPRGAHAVGSPDAVPEHSRCARCRWRSDSWCRCYCCCACSRLPGRRSTGRATHAGLPTRFRSASRPPWWRWLSCCRSRTRCAPPTGVRPNTLVRGAVRLMSLGYAVPGAVIAVGILMPLAAFDNRLDAVMRSALGVGPACC